MPDVQVTMAATGPTADVPTNSRAQLNLPVGSTPVSWTKNAVTWSASSVLVHPTIGGDDVYKVVDQNGTALSVVVRWKPDPPANVQLETGKGNADVTWDAIGDESRIDYYRVDLDPQPATMQLPRNVMRGARARGTKRILPLDGLPPDFYTAAVSAVRDASGGPVSSEPTTSDSSEVCQPADSTAVGSGSCWPSSASPPWVVPFTSLSPARAAPIRSA
jgi:hypothetical protein